MSDTFARRLAWSIWLFSMVGIAGALAASLGGPDSWLTGGIASVAANLGASLFVVVFGTVGALIASRRPHNPIGWLLSAAAVCFVVPGIAIALGTSVERYSDWLSSWIWMVGITIGMVFVLFLFPNGRLPSARWRPVAAIAWIGLGMFVLGSALLPGTIEETSSTNPFGLGGTIGHTVFGAMRGGGLAVVLVSVPLAIGSLVFRYRAADAIEREQVRWLIFAGALVIAAIVLNSIVAQLVAEMQTAIDLGNAAASISASAVPIAIGIAILKYRLYDIDVVIKKTLVFGLLAVFITVVYAAIVALVSTRFEGSQVGSFIAAATLAVLFAPARDRARRIADRLVYGKRATPYEVLSEFSDRVGGAYAADDVLSRMAQVLMEGTGAVGARVLLQVGDEQREAAAVGDRGAETVVEVTHQQQALGALAVSMPAADPMNPAKRQLVDDLAAQAGLVLRNVKLIEEVKASRQRLVAAQDEERRKIERNIHDGAQQQLVALAVQLNLAHGMVGKDPEKRERLLSRLGDADERGARGSARPRTRDLSAAARGQGLGRRLGGPGAQSRGPNFSGGRRDRAIRPGHRIGRLLLVPRGAAKRGQVRGRHRRGHHAVERRRTTCGSPYTMTVEGSTRDPRAMAPACRGSPIAWRRSAAS